MDTAAFTIGVEPGDTVQCVITNQYYEGNVRLTKTLTNDDGGTATMADFTLELFRAGDGTPVATGVCAADGVCLEGDFPIGDYVVGEIGPDGYTRTVTQQISQLVSEQLEAEAAFTLEVDSEVIVNVASNDQPTTTTTTTTTVAPTTAAPTVAPTTSALAAGAGTLPPTGPTDNTGTFAAIAIALLLLGAGATALARRRP